MKLADDISDGTGGSQRTIHPSYRARYAYIHSGHDIKGAGIPHTICARSCGNIPKMYQLKHISGNTSNIYIEYMSAYTISTIHNYCNSSGIHFAAHSNSIEYSIMATYRTEMLAPRLRTKNAHKHTHTSTRIGHSNNLCDIIRPRSAPSDRFTRCYVFLAPLM